jgi:hypothetical protein
MFASFWSSDFSNGCVVMLQLPLGKPRDGRLVGREVHVPPGVIEDRVRVLVL